MNDRMNTSGRLLTDTCLSARTNNACYRTLNQLDSSLDLHIITSWHRCRPTGIPGNADPTSAPLFTKFRLEYPGAIFVLEDQAFVQPIHKMRLRKACQLP